MRLDELLWVPGSLRILNADNVPLRGVYPGSVRDGLALIGQGSAAALMGTLRPGIRVVDVDLDDPLASRARDGVLAWAAERGYATLVRPSGKAGHVSAHTQQRSRATGTTSRRPLRPQTFPASRHGWPSLGGE